MSRAAARGAAVLGAMLALGGCSADERDPGGPVPGDPAARNPRIRAISTVHASGARPRFSPDGARLVFDRQNQDGFYDLYISDTRGGGVTGLTAGRDGLAQRHNGNGIFDATGRFIVFISEVNEHFASSARGLGDPGIGLYSNLWATTVDATQLWQLTDIPIKRTLLDGVPSVATVNPVFALDGRTLVWTERYAEGGGDWGRWRLKAAEWVVDGGVPSLRGERVLYTPSRGNYVSAMGFLDANRLVVAGNLDGQHEFGMDQYILSIDSGRVTNLTSTPDVWEEDSCVGPNGQIVYMTNAGSAFPLDFSNPNWPSQPRTREYHLMNSDGSGKERLTYFNDPAAPESVGRRVITAACDISPDGRFLTGIQGVDTRTDNTSALALRVVMIEFATPLRSTPSVSLQPSRAHDASGIAAAGDEVLPWLDTIDAGLISGTLRATSTQRDSMLPGRAHQRFVQLYGNLPVFGAYAVQQTSGPTVLTVFGTLHDDIEVPVDPALPGDRAAEIALAAQPAAARLQGTPQLGVLPLDGGRYLLAYRVVVRRADDLQVVYVDARTGAVAWQMSLLRGWAATAAGETPRAQPPRVAARPHAPGAPRGTRAAYRAFEFGGSAGRLSSFLETGRLAASDEVPLPSGSADPVLRESAAVHAEVAAYLERRFGRRGLDDAGAPAVAILHPPTLDAATAHAARFATGAWYAGGGAVVYGDGDGQAIAPLAAARDVVAHQTAYGILDAASGLAELGEGIELADGFAAVLAAGIDLASGDDAAHPWALGERVASPAGNLLRNRVAQAFFHATTLDNHPAPSAAVRDRAARMERVFYRAFVFFLGPGATMDIACAATLQAAVDLYPAAPADWDRLRRAWQAAGVPCATRTAPVEGQ